MSVNEFYDKIEGNYEDIKGRLRSDELIARFLQKFLTENTYSSLVEAVEAQDVEASIFAVHKLKGVAANLSFTKLFELSNAFLTDLRKENQTVVDKEMMQQVATEYERVIQAIQEM